MRDLNEIHFESVGTETERSVTKIEETIGVRIPSQFRSHLLTYGGGYLADCIVDCRVPTPFCEHNIVQINSAEDILRTIPSDIVPPNLLCIGHGHLGLWTCVSLAGIDHGTIYAFDSEMRFFWNQDRIRSNASLDARIKKFFQMRERKELPRRPWGYENCYEICESFNKFLTLLKVVD